MLYFGLCTLDENAYHWHENGCKESMAIKYRVSYENTTFGCALELSCSFDNKFILEPISTARRHVLKIIFQPEHVFAEQWSAS